MFCTLCGGRDRTWKERGKKGWPIYWEGRRPNCTCKILSNEDWMNAQNVDVLLKHIIQKKERGKPPWQRQVRVVILPPSICRISINTPTIPHPQNLSENCMLSGKTHLPDSLLNFLPNGHFQAEKNFMVPLKFRKCPLSGKIGTEEEKT